MTINHTLRKVNGMLATIPVYQISGPKRYKIKYEAVIHDNSNSLNKVTKINTNTIPWSKMTNHNNIYIKIYMPVPYNNDIIAILFREIYYLKIPMIQ